MPLDRVTITIPRELVAAADRLARRQDRSRSWVISDALRRSTTPEETARPTEPSADSAAFADARHRRLLADLALSPTDRLVASQDLADLASLARPRARRRQILAFDSLGDFAAWKAARRIGA